LTRADAPATVRRGHNILWWTIMRCPWCSADEDRVVDSRPADSGAAIRRRRECLRCGRRFTTYERAEEAGLLVRKRDGSRVPFERDKLASGLYKALTNRPVGPGAVESMVDRIEGRLRRKGPEIRSQQIGVEVLAALRRSDEIAYLRFASVYKDFQEVTDFSKEMDLLLEKKEPSARRPRR
jgi:transcriptional repressor NrdR